MPWAVTPTIRRLAQPGAHGHADQAVHLLGGDVGDRGALLDRVARADRDLAAERPLALDDPLGDALGERLDPTGLADHHLVDRLVDRLLEARHVDALLVRPEVAEAGDLRVEEPLRRRCGGSVIAFADRVTAGAGEADGWPAGATPGGPPRRCARVVLILMPAFVDSAAARGIVTDAGRPGPSDRPGMIPRDLPPAPARGRTAFMTTHRPAAAPVEIALPDVEEMRRARHGRPGKGFLTYDEIVGAPPGRGGHQGADRGLLLAPARGRHRGAGRRRRGHRLRTASDPHRAPPELDLTVEPSLDCLRLYLREIGRVPLLTAEPGGRPGQAHRARRPHRQGRRWSRPTCAWWCQHRQGLPGPRPLVPRPDPGGQPRPHPGRREVRLPQRLQVLEPTPPGGSARR